MLPQGMKGFVCPKKFMLSPEFSRLFLICVVFSHVTLTKVWKIDCKAGKSEDRDQLGDYYNRTGSDHEDEEPFKAFLTGFTD